jgi:hypothetical protein
MPQTKSQTQPTACDKVRGRRKRTESFADWMERIDRSVDRQAQ